jgi:TniQ
MKPASAPSQLPFAPRPFINELFSSWMLRIADANCVSLQELMLGFQSSHPNVPCPNSLDWGFTPAFSKAMARFCRTPIGALHSLDLRTRLPQAESALLLRLRAVSDRCLRLCKERVGYAFCPTCISQQPYVHVRWEWAFPALLRCHVHKSPLRHGCPTCGEEDPLPFGTAPAVMRVLCWNCGENLTGTITGSHVGQVDGAQAIVEKVYRAALRGTSPHSALLGEATGTQFRRFVDDLLQLLAWYPSPDLSPRLTDPRNLYLPFRKEILAIVAALVMDAAPASEPNGRNIKFRREDLTLWLRVLALLSQREAESIETASELWPPALRRRLNSALDQHERSSSRSSPFRSTFFRPGLKYINRFEFREFSAASEVE